MSPGDYEPRPGSLAERLIDYLEATGEERISRSDVAKRFTVNSYSIGPSLEPAIRHKALAELRIDGRVWYALPSDSRSLRAPVEAQVPTFVSGCEAQDSDDFAPDTTFDDPPEHEFLMALWSDGDLDIFAAEAISLNGVDGIRLNADQVEQLRCLLLPRAQ